MAKSSFCSDKPRTCFSSLIDEAEYIFEGTVKETEIIKNKNGDTYFKTILIIDKILKGNYQGKEVTFIGNENLLWDYFVPNISEEERLAHALTMSPTKVGRSGIFLGMASEYNFNNIKMPFEQVLSKNKFLYDLDFNKDLYNNDKKQNVFGENAKNELSGFASFEDVYDFILTHKNTKCLDVSFKEYQKETHEQWKARKNGFEK